MGKVMINAAVMGYGVIGSGVVEVLKRNAAVVAAHAGDTVRVTRVLDLKDLTGTAVEDIWTKDFNDILTDPDIDIVVEVMGGTGAAYKFVKASLEAGKSVVTSNKALVAAYGPELISIAREKNINFFFEASVGGGIPIIRPLLDCITADEILEICGILNGTTNFILSKMYDEGSEFGAVLKEAQANGFAEADPAADIEGHDACRKIAILTSLAYGQFVDFEDIPCRGISDIDPADIEYAKMLGRKIKLFGMARKENDKVFAEVSPFMTDPQDPLFAVDGVMNAIVVKGNMLGEVMFYGAGAGSLPTASAVVSDIIVAAQNLSHNIFIKMDAEKQAIDDGASVMDKYFIRFAKGSDTSSLPVSEKLSLENRDEFALVTEELSGADISRISAMPGFIKAIKVK